MYPEIDPEEERKELLFLFDDLVASNEQEIQEALEIRKACRRLMQGIIISVEIPEDEWNEIHSSQTK